MLRRFLDQPSSSLNRRLLLFTSSFDAPDFSNIRVKSSSSKNRNNKNSNNTKKRPSSSSVKDSSSSSKPDWAALFDVVVENASTKINNQKSNAQQQQQPQLTLPSSLPTIKKEVREEPAKSEPVSEI